MANDLISTFNAIPGRLLLLSTSLALYVAVFGFPLHWFISGAPFLTALLLLGNKERHVSTVVPLAINLAYAVCHTSWLLFWVFVSVCYPLLFVVSLYRITVVGNVIRRVLRKFLRELQFPPDRIALFNIPALEIDTEVDGLMVIRGLTISLSSLTIVAHGVEVGIKLSDDLEMAIQTNKVTIRLFRTIEVEDVYANIKGGEFEMTFGHLGDSSDNANGAALMQSDTPLLQAAAMGAGVHDKTTMKNKMTPNDRSMPKSTSPESGLKSVTQLSPDDEKAQGRYDDAIAEIERTSSINQSERKIKNNIRSISSADAAQFDYRNKNDMRAAICSALHDTPSIAHPPKRSIKVTTLQHLSPPWVRRFMHRLPLLLRLLLYVLSYLHTVTIASVTAAGSGKWIQYMLDQHVFQHYAEEDSEIRKLNARVSGWLSDANFAVEIGKININSHVPLNPIYNILCLVRLNDIMAYRTVPQQIDLKQVLSLRGASAEVEIPSFLLPHHEHLLPPKPTKEDEREAENNLERTSSRIQEVIAEHELDQTRKDETNMIVSARVRLPAACDQELLDWIAALVKATKLIEWEKEPGPLEEKEKHSIKEFAKGLHISMRDGVKRIAVDAIAQDKWIAKLVGKLTRKLESAQGDVGYSGEVPIALKPYRDLAEPATKLLP